MGHKSVVELLHAGGVLAEQAAAGYIEAVSSSAEVAGIRAYLPVNSYGKIHVVEFFFYFAGIEIISVYRNQHHPGSFHGITHHNEFAKHIRLSVFTGVYGVNINTVVILARGQGVNDEENSLVDIQNHEFKE